MKQSGALEEWLVRTGAEVCGEQPVEIPWASAGKRQKLTPSRFQSGRWSLRLHRHCLQRLPWGPWELTAGVPSGPQAASLRTLLSGAAGFLLYAPPYRVPPWHLLVLTHSLAGHRWLTYQAPTYDLPVPHAMAHCFSFCASVSKF